MTREITASFSLHPARSSVGSSTFSGGEKTGFFVPRNMSTKYADKLKDPRWQKKRLEIMERDGFACQECGDKTTMLAVHHAYYVSGRAPWMYPDWSLSTLCDECHQAHHDREKEKSEDNAPHYEDEWEAVIGFLGIRKMSDFSADYWSLAVSVAMKSDEFKARGISACEWLGWAIEEMSQKEIREKQTQ